MITEDQIWQALQDVRDPELPISVVDLGLVYDVQIADSRVEVKMTLTTKGCPMHQQITQDVRERILQVPEVQDVIVGIVWDPRWNKNMISPEGKKALGYASPH